MVVLQWPFDYLMVVQIPNNRLYGRACAGFVQTLSLYLPGQPHYNNSHSITKWPFVQFSDESGSQAFSIQIPTVFD
jgi:hypothetical protein